jgi:iron-sulfur cluster assembly protein
MEITITNSAIDKVLSLMKEEGKENYFLKVSVEGGGCSGLKYNMNFISDKEDKDILIPTNTSLNILVDKRSLLYLVGTELDYNSGLNGKGFVFNNPNSTRTCGCGESFSI